MTGDVEQRLFRALRSGDAAAFDQLYDHYRPRLFSFLVRLTKQQEVAEDLLQETWIRLAACAPTLRADTTLGPWLFTVARNLYFSWRRSRAVDETRVTELDPSWPAPDRGDSPFEAAAQAELERCVEAALGRLPFRDREVLLLVGVVGLTPSEAAAACGLPAVTLRARLHRAREKLAAEMGVTRAEPRAKAG